MEIYTATNKPVRLKGMVVYTLKDGKIVKGEPISDVIGDARQLGLKTIILD